MRQRLAHVELTENSVRIDGQDISHQVTHAQLEVGVDQLPVLRLVAVPWLVTFSGDAVVVDAPLDGIARLRKRFSLSR